MTNFYKEDYYNINELIEILKTLPQNYRVETCHNNFDCHYGRIDDITIDDEDEAITFWFS